MDEIERGKCKYLQEPKRRLPPPEKLRLLADMFDVVDSEGVETTDEIQKRFASMGR